MNSPGQRHAGELVQLARAQLGLSQAELADKARVNATTVSSLETGKRWPRPSSQLGITRALGWEDGELERMARSYGAEEPRENAAVAILLDALADFERRIMTDPRLRPGERDAVIALHREAGGEKILNEYRERIRRVRGEG